MEGAVDSGRSGEPVLAGRARREMGGRRLTTYSHSCGVEGRSIVGADEAVGTMECVVAISAT